MGEREDKPATLGERLGELFVESVQAKLTRDSESLDRVLTKAREAVEGTSH